MLGKKILAFVLISIFFGASNGLELDDSCDASRYPSSSNPIEYDSYTRCDPRQGLYCNPQTSRCSCYVVDSEYYDDTCRGKIGFPCKASPTFTIACGENAMCEEHTGFCRCEEFYMATPDDKFNCNSGHSIISNVKTLIVFIASLILFTFGGHF